ncbi:6748_t:CDS:2 [Entrophospora sp. SA101]|nr:3133_t:CDS:2 [Entrophospora sp. SA101]CAJ0896908.1 6748_t:CDS:2 [Entrophospora sp. SA101]
MSFAGSTNKSSCPNSIIKMWVLLEGKPKAIKLKADLSEAKDLEDFIPILKREFEELKNIKNQNIVFLDNNNNTLIPPDTCKCNIPHTGGSLKEIRNEYSFNTLASQTELNGNNYNLKLKVKVEGKKSYRDWELKDVFKEILRWDYKSLGGIPRFNLNDLLSLEHPFTENELKNHINKSAQLSMKIELEGSREYGPVDYMVVTVKILVLLCEAKAENMNKGTAQVLVQMHSAIEQQLDKHKHGQMEQAMFGIVTTGKLWRFVRWTGSLEEPTVHISEEYTCNFKGNMEPEKEMSRYIVQRLQAQAMAFGVDDKDSGHPSKRQYFTQIGI